MRWFKHQTAAHNDAKLKKLILRQGMAAYGLYWYCLELIGKDVSESRLTFEIEEDSELIAHATGMTRDQVEAAMRCMVELGLFESVEGRITCLQMLRHMDASMFKSGDVRDRFQQKKTEILERSPSQTEGNTGTVHVPSMADTSTVRGKQDKTGQDITDKPLLSSPDGEDANPKTKTPYEEVRKAWNTICVPAGLPEGKLLNNKRKSHIRQRHGGPIIRSDITNWHEYFQAITKSQLLTGKVNGWRADFDFAITDKAMTRTLEGFYHQERKEGRA